ncbi:MAG: hypothetical protein ENTB_00006 [Enterocloster aldenensis]
MGMQGKITALYERLSRDDDFKGKKRDSNSIVHQKQYLEDFARRMGFTNIRHFTDDGYTGVNFDRPGFQAMIKEIEAGNVAICLCKDLSRFGRNYLQVGFYTEIMFPQKGVRFIAINNNIDSANPTENDFTPFLNIMNEWYARDTSNKIKCIFEARMQDGKRCSGSIPYGYNRLPGDKQTLVVDSVASGVVRRIFGLANEGKTPGEIAGILTAEKVLIPAAYTERYHPEQYNGYHYSDPYQWGKDTIRKILDRKEYLGHTVLKKTKSTSFKLHKREETSEDEQYIFYGTHEPIIPQELWDSVQRRRKRVSGKAARGSRHHRLSGYLYCADCGSRLSLQTHKKKSDGSPTFSYRCSGYANRTKCTAHSIGADVVEELLLTAVQRISRHVLADEQAFAEELKAGWQRRQDTQPRQDRDGLARLKKQYNELSNRVRELFEHFVSGIVSERQYKELMKQYDDEQGQLEAEIQRLEGQPTVEPPKTADIDRFIAIVRKYKDPAEVTDTMLFELVDRIVVHEGEGQGSNRRQRVDIYYNFVGQFELAYTDEEIAEMEAAREQEEAERLARQRSREKERRERRKAQRIAENGGEAAKKKICPHCGREFVPGSNRQMFCTVECRKAHHQEQRDNARQEERGEHFYRQKTCAVCGEPFYPNSSQSRFCGEACRRKHHSEYSLAWWHEKQERAAV